MNDDKQIKLKILDILRASTTEVDNFNKAVFESEFEKVIEEILLVSLDTKPTKRYIGFTASMSGEELWTNTDTDEIVKFTIKDKETR